MFRTLTKLPVCGIIACALLLAGCIPRSASPTTSPTPTLSPSPTASLTPTVVWFPPTPTRTPFPSRTPLPPTPDQRPGIGDIVFADDFSTADDWALSSTARGSVALGKNKLTIAIAAPKTYLSSVRSQPVAADFYAEITAGPNLCRGTDEYGLLIRVSSEQDYYRFSVSCDGQTRLDRVHRGQASSPQPWMLASGLPVGSPSSSRLAVWAVGSEMRFFINDEYQFTVRDPLLPSGRIGIFARSAGDTAVTVNFSELVIRVVSRNSPASTVSTPPPENAKTLAENPKPTLTPEQNASLTPTIPTQAYIDPRKLLGPGQYVVFWRANTWYIQGLDGSPSQRFLPVDTPNSAASLSPDGEKVAFTTMEDRIAVFDLTSGTQTTYPLILHWATRFSWSPDSQILLAGGIVGGPYKPSSPSGESDYPKVLYAIWIQDGRYACLGCKGTNAEKGFYGEKPAWSPESRWLVFTVDKEEPIGMDNYNLYVIRPDGTGLRQVTTNLKRDCFSFWQP